jgi:hypothetical protein
LPLIPVFLIARLTWRARPPRTSIR